MESNIGPAGQAPRHDRRHDDRRRYRCDGTGGPSGEVFRAGLPFSRSMQPIWYWLVFVCGPLAGLRHGGAAHRHRAGSGGCRDGPVVGPAARPSGPRAGAAVPGSLANPPGASGRIAATTEPAARFEGGDAPSADLPPGADQASAEPAHASAEDRLPGVAPDKPQQPEDFASRLMKAKKKVWEERDKDKGKEAIIY